MKSKQPRDKHEVELAWAHWQKLKRKENAKRKPDAKLRIQYQIGHEYVNGPSIGLWASKRGSASTYYAYVRGDHLTKVTAFMEKAVRRGYDIKLAVFKSEPVLDWESM